jgi:activator of 2-hydroxyglutaryl-CoA dehydratase
MGMVPDIIMTGGVALNKGVVSALEQEIGEKITIAGDPQLIGAMGAALYASEMASGSQ